MLNLCAIQANVTVVSSRRRCARRTLNLSPLGSAKSPNMSIPLTDPFPTPFRHIPANGNVTRQSSVINALYWRNSVPSRLRKKSAIKSSFPSFSTICLFSANHCLSLFSASLGIDGGTIINSFFIIHYLINGLAAS